MSPRNRAIALVVPSTLALTIAFGGSAEAFITRIDAGPERVYPMRAIAEYGDGLGAGRDHGGLDMFAAAGTPLVAVEDGVVLETGSDGGRGNYVTIYAPKSKRSFNYFHMLGPATVGAGQKVRAGQKLGELGCTGSCYGDHLHFEVRQGRGGSGPVLDPVVYLEPVVPKPPKNRK